MFVSQFCGGANSIWFRNVLEIYQGREILRRLGFMTLSIALPTSPKAICSIRLISLLWLIGPQLLLSHVINSLRYCFQLSVMASWPYAVHVLSTIDVTLLKLIPGQVHNPDWMRINSCFTVILLFASQFSDGVTHLPQLFRQVHFQ